MSEGNISAATRPPLSDTIFVGNLHDGVDVEFLKVNFETALGGKECEIHRVNLVHDRVTGAFRNFAFIQFANPSFVQKAIRNLNSSKVYEKQILVSMALRPFHVTLGQNIILKNIPKEANSVHLYDLLAQFGDIISIKRPVDETTNEPLHYAFASFVDESSAAEAIKAINELQQKGQSLITAEQFVPRHVRQRDWRSVYVKVLPESWDKEKLGEVLSQFGKVESAHVQLKEDGTSKGFGFVTFERHEDAVKAVDKSGQVFPIPGQEDGFTLFISRHQTRRERDIELDKLRKQWRIERTLLYRGKNLYVKNLPPEMTQEQFARLFEPYGKILSARLQRSSTNPELGTGVGFILFDTPEAAQNALRERKNFVIEGKNLYVSFFQSKADRSVHMSKVMKNRGSRPNTAAVVQQLKEDLKIDNDTPPQQAKQAIGNYLFNHYNSRPEYQPPNPQDLLPRILGVMLGSLEVHELLEIAAHEHLFRNYANDATKLLMQPQAH